MSGTVFTRILSRRHLDDGTFCNTLKNPKSLGAVVMCSQCFIMS